MNFSGQNINRVNAVKQLAKGTKDENELQILGSLANTFIYMVDEMKRRNDLLERQLDSEED